MTPIREFPIRWRLLLPLLVAVVLLLTPQAGPIRLELEGSRLTNSLEEPGAAASHRVILANWEPWRSELWQQAARLALIAGKPDLAISYLDKAGTVHPLDSEGQLLLGEAYWIQENSLEAIKVWSPMLDLHVAPGELYRRVLQFYRVTGQLEKAIRVASLWAEAYPASGEAAFTFGLLSLAGDWRVSSATLEKAVKLDTNWNSSSQIIIRALQRSGEGAPEEYRLVEIGRALGSLGEWDLALTVFQHAVKVNPTYAEAWAFSSAARLQLNQDGSQDLKRALELAPESPLIQALAALDDRRQGKVQQALEKFQAAAKFEPQRALWLVEIGNTYADLHDNQKGLESYQKAVQIEPQNPVIWRLLAQYCLEKQIELRSVGLPAARQANLLSTNDPVNLDTLGQVMLGLDDAVSAERFLQQALDKDPDNPAAHLHLGQLFLNQQKMDWAHFHLAQAARPGRQDDESSLIARRLLSRYFGGK